MKSVEKLRGFTLVEAIVAVGILAVILGSLIPSFVFYYRHNSDMEARMEAVTAAQQVLDEQRAVNPASLPSSGMATQNALVGNRVFTIRTSYCLQAAYCGPNTRHITVEVDYNGKQIYRTETVYTQLH